MSPREKSRFDREGGMVRTMPFVLEYKVFA